MTEAPQQPNAPRGEAAFIAWLQRPGLALRLCLISVALSSPCILTGWHLDDMVARYIYTDLPGAHRLYALYMGGYGLANGDPAVNHWQIEQGWAPWWIYDQLRLRMFRPVGLMTHWLDALAWPNSAALMHVQSLFWLGLLVLAITRMYRSVLGKLTAPMAALLFAIDHTHGFEVGYICNRYALVTALFGVLSFDCFLRSRVHGDRHAAFIGPLLYIVALLSGESTIAIAGYVLAYAVFAEAGPWLRRALACSPYLLITLIWRAAYNRAGYGATGSGLYIDPGREPMHFFLELLQRGPVLLQGLFSIPPAELHPVLGPSGALLLLLAAWLTVAALVVALVPLLVRDRLARAWTAGMLFALIPASSTYPHNRQLLFASIGGMALIAQLWQLHALQLRGTQMSRALQWSGKISAFGLLVHLLLSPLGLPVSSCGIAVSTPLSRAPDTIGDEIAGSDAIFMTAPDYFAVKLVQLSRRVQKQSLPRHWRALSFGEQAVTVRRTDERTLELDYDGGILQTPFTELYRDRRLPMRVGERIELEGLSIEVLQLTSDGRPSSARFRFTQPLDAPSFRFYAWIDGRFVPFTPPPVGQRRVLPPATVRWSFS
ncbi:MAG TPA: hypothetical protein VF331_20145 [Polyangiales bacterium]